MNWIQIIWKCQKNFPITSKAYGFASQQCVNFAFSLLSEARQIKQTGIIGHKASHKYLPKYYVYDGQPDLLCDDPLYDGEYIR